MSHNERKLWLVCYDVCDPARLRRVYRTMRGYGDHLQFSVFRCLLSDTQRKQLEQELLENLAVESDQVLFVPMGRPEGPGERGMYTLGTPLAHPERVCHVV
jgi:CRISPR-associated protein Cas2